MPHAKIPTDSTATKDPSTPGGTDEMKLELTQKAVKQAAHAMTLLPPDPTWLEIRNRLWEQLDANPDSCKMHTRYHRVGCAHCERE